MSRIRDFRLYATVAIENVDRSGKNVGKAVYWKLYAIENLYRIIVHSILSTVFYPEDWWEKIDSTIQKKAERNKLDYLARPLHTSPGNHPIYFVGLTDINRIANAHSHLNLVIQLIPDIDKWVGKIEALRLPRNVVAHMNFPSVSDRKRIDAFYNEFKSLFVGLQKNSPFVFSSP